MDSPLTRWLITSTPTSSTFSLISLVGFFSNSVRIHGLLTTSVKRMGFWFSKVRGLFFLYSLCPCWHLLGICGKLEGEHIVRAVIAGNRCKWCRVDPPPSQPGDWVPLQNWREVFDHVLHSQDVKIRITITEAVTSWTHSDESCVTAILGLVLYLRWLYCMGQDCIDDTCCCTTYAWYVKMIVCVWKHRRVPWGSDRHFVLKDKHL